MLQTEAALNAVPGRDRETAQPSLPTLAPSIPFFSQLSPSLIVAANIDSVQPIPAY